MIKLIDGLYQDENGKYPRLTYLLDMMFCKPPYLPGAAKRGQAIHEWLAAINMPTRNKRWKIENSGEARPYIENYKKFLEDFGLKSSRGRMVETPFVGKFNGILYGFDRDFKYGCTVDAYFPGKKTLVEIKTGSRGVNSKIMGINRDRLQILLQARAIDINMDLRLIIVYLSEKNYKTVVVSNDGLLEAKNLIIPALICWYSENGGKNERK